MSITFAKSTAFDDFWHQITSQIYANQIDDVKTIVRNVFSGDNSVTEWKLFRDFKSGPEGFEYQSTKAQDHYRVRKADFKQAFEYVQTCGLREIDGAALHRMQGILTPKSSIANKNTRSWIPLFATLYNAYRQAQGTPIPEND